MRKILGAILAVTLLYACSSDQGSGTPDEKPDPVSFKRGPMLINWADNIIIPSYTDFSQKIAGLTASFETFKSGVDEGNLINLRTAWFEAYKAWQHLDMFEIGPAEAVGLRLNINIYPTKVDKIESNAANNNYDLALPSNRDAKGFPALDYLINGLADTDADIVSILGSASAKDTYIAYMGAVIKNMQELSDQVLSEWKKGYRDTFVKNDGASSTASVDRFVNEYIFYYEKFLRAGKMGYPLGIFSGSTLPGNLEGYYKGDISKQLFLEGLNAVQNFFNGKHFGTDQKGESLASYLDALNTVKNGEDLNKVINDQFNIARTKVTALDSFLNEIENHVPPNDMLLAYDEVQRIVPLLKVDMVSAMSISIAYVDTDGD